MRVLPTSLAVLATLALAGAAAAPAPAATAVARSVRLAAGPEVAGSSIVWGQPTAHGGLAVRAARPGRRPRTLFRWAPPERPTRLVLTGLAASATHVAMARTAVVDGPDRPALAASEGVVLSEPAASATVLMAGPLGGPFRRIAGRRGPRTAGGCRPQMIPSEPALSGSRLVYLEVERRCTAGGEQLVDRIVIADLARPGRPPRVLATGTPYFAGGEPARGLSSPRIAGHYVAWQIDRPAGSAARAVDLRTGRVVQSVGRVRGGDRGDILEWFAVAADGALVLSFQPDARGHALAVRRPGGSTRVLPQRLPSGSSGYEPGSAWAAAEGGCVAVVGGLRRFGLWVTDRGGRGRAIATFDAARPLAGDPSFDGRRAAWALGSPRRATIYAARAGC